MIRLESAAKIFYPGTANENTAIRNLSLTVNEGDFITVIGSNGAGKSTLFNLIAGSLSLSSGKVFFRDCDCTTEPEYKRAMRIGRVFQNPSLGTASGMTVEENMTVAHRKGMKGLRTSLNDKLRNQFRDELKSLGMGLEDRLKTQVSLLSGGQRQALTLLMVVLSRPSLVLLDEHTAALDPKNAAIVLDLTRRFIADYKLTAMMITHNMAHAIEYGCRLLMMDRGEIILDISGSEKQNLTVEKLVKKFHEIRHYDLESDRVLLSEE